MFIRDKMIIMVIDRAKSLLQTIRESGQNLARICCQKKMGVQQEKYGGELYQQEICCQGCLWHGRWYCIQKAHQREVTKDPDVFRFSLRCRKLSK